MARSTREVTAEHRAAVVASAAKLFCERGVDGVSVNQVMSAAGLTHGGFYKQFESKAALAVEACELSFANAVQRLGAGSFENLIEQMLGPRCPRHVPRVVVGT